MDELIETVELAYWSWRWWFGDPLIPALILWLASGVVVSMAAWTVVCLTGQR